MKSLISFVGIVLLAGCASHSSPQTYTFCMPVNQPGWAPGTTIVSTNPVVYVGGEVRAPGRFLWHPGLTISNAIASAGGLTDFANGRRVKLSRTRCDGTNYLITVIQITGPVTNTMALEQDDQLRVGQRYF